MSFTLLSSTPTERGFAARRGDFDLIVRMMRAARAAGLTVTAGILLGAALVLFAAFYPLESGLPCPRAYAKHLRWFKWYNF